MTISIGYKCYSGKKSAPCEKFIINEHQKHIIHKAIKCQKMLTSLGEIVGNAFLQNLDVSSVTRQVLDLQDRGPVLQDSKDVMWSIHFHLTLLNYLKI